MKPEKKEFAVITKDKERIVRVEKHREGVVGWVRVEVVSIKAEHVKRKIVGLTFDEVYKIHKLLNKTQYT